MFEIKHLRSLIALKKTDSLAAASEMVHISQSALSHQMSELEQRIGKLLFVRKTNPIQFTVEGLLLLQLAKQMLPEVERVTTQLKGLPTISCLRIAMECHSCIRWLSPIFARIKQELPKIDFDLSGAQLFSSQQALLQGDVDLVLTADPLPLENIHYEALFDFEMRVVMNQEHKFREEQQLTPEHFQSEVLLSYPVDVSRLDVMRFFLTPANIQPARIKHVDNSHMLMQMVAGGWGIAVVPDWVSEEFESTSLLRSAPLGSGLWRKLYAAIRVDGRDREEYTAVFKALQQR